MEFLENVDTIMGIIVGILTILAFFGLTRWSQMRGYPKERIKPQTHGDVSVENMIAEWRSTGETKKESPSYNIYLWITVLIVSPFIGFVSYYIFEKSDIDVNDLLTLFVLSIPSIATGFLSNRWLLALFLGGLSTFIMLLTNELLDLLDRGNLIASVPVLLFLSVIGATIGLFVYAVKMVIVKRFL